MVALNNLFKISRSCSTWIAAQHRPTRLSTKFCKDFDDFYPQFIDKTFERSKYIDHPIIKDDLKKITNYYKKYPMRGELMMHAYDLLEKRDNIKDKALHQVYSVACALELTQYYLYFQEDIFDQRLSRAGKTCWYLLHDASKLLVNDTISLRSLINEILRQNLNETFYVQITNVNENCYFFTEIGQYLDLMLPKTKGYDNYTMDNYKMISLKATYFGMIYPIQAALVLSNKGNKETFQLISDLLDDYGTMLQMNNDFREYVDYDKTKAKKSKSDIEMRKCSWNAVIALQHFSKEDRKIFEECYGSSDPDKVKQVIRLYNKIDLAKLYRKAEVSYNEGLLRKIKALPSDCTLSPDFFISIMQYFKSHFSNIDRYH